MTFGVVSSAPATDRAIYFCAFRLIVVAMSWAFEYHAHGGRRYLYAVEKRRTPKGPRNTRYVYLGTAESLLKRLATPGKPLKSFEFGKLGAMVHAAQETGLLEALRHHAPRGYFDGYSVENILFLQTAARVEKPMSRESMAGWLSDSILPSILPATGHPSSRTLRRYLKRLYGAGEGEQRGEGLLSRSVIHRIEAEVFQTLLKKGINPRWMLFDTTNFFADHQGGRLMRRAHSKQKRYDKLHAGLGLVTLGDLPILSEVYPANEGDAKVFARVFDSLVKRLVDLEVATDRLIMVFDRGITSEDNFEKVREAMHVIAALNRQQAQKLFRTPPEEFEEVGKDSEGKPVKGFPTRWSGFGQDWRVLVTYRKTRAEHEEKTWNEVRTRVLSQVEAWRKRPATKEQALWAKLTRLIPKPFQAEFEVRLETVKVQRKGKEVPGYLPVVRVLPEAEARLKASFGKTAIITDLETRDLPDGKLVEGFVARAGVEEDFKWLKDRHVVSVKPFWVWHDATVAGHTFLCVMGLMLYRWLQWRSRDLGLSLKALVETLEGIRIGVVKTTAGKPEMVIEELNPLQGRVFSALDLGEMIPQ